MGFFFPFEVVKDSAALLEIEKCLAFLPAAESFENVLEVWVKKKKM
jgi:hypothetical protein